MKIFILVSLIFIQGCTGENLKGFGDVMQAFGDGYNGNNSRSSYSSGYSNSYSSPSTGYSSSYGNHYQYHLSNPVDRVRYNSDPSARLRDRVTPNPYRNIESNTNQSGGGIYGQNNSPQWNWVR